MKNCEVYKQNKKPHHSLDRLFLLVFKRNVFKFSSLIYY